MMMGLVTLIFPIVQIFKHKKAARETQAILAEFDAKKLNSEPSATGSLATRSTGSKRGKMYSMESLDECLTTGCDGLQVYASCMELNGENIIFLTKVLGFQRKWAMDFSKIRELFSCAYGHVPSGSQHLRHPCPFRHRILSNQYRKSYLRQAGIYLWRGYEARRIKAQ